MPKAVLLAASTAFLLLGVSCSGGGEPQVSEPQVSEEFVTAAEEAVAAALLTPDDLPPGWSAEPQDEDEDDETDIEFTGECEPYNEDEFPGSVAGADSDKLTGPENQLLYTSAEVFPSEETAEAAAAEFVKFLDTCGQQLQDAMVESFRTEFEDRGAPATEITVSVEDLQFEEFGSGMGSYRVNWSVMLEGRTLRGSMDVVSWRQGKIIGGFVYMRFGDENLREEQELAQLIDAKLRFVDATLPS